MCVCVCPVCRIVWTLKTAAFCVWPRHRWVYPSLSLWSLSQWHSVWTHQVSKKQRDYRVERKRIRAQSAVCEQMGFFWCVFWQGRCAEDLYKGIQSSDAGVRCDSLKELASVSTDVTFAQEFINRDGHLLLVKIVEDSNEWAHFLTIHTPDLILLAHTVGDFFMAVWTAQALSNCNLGIFQMWFLIRHTADFWQPDLSLNLQIMIWRNDWSSFMKLWCHLPLNKCNRCYL